MIGGGNLKKITLFLFYIALILITTGCATKDMQDYKNQQQPVTLSDFVLGEGVYEEYKVEMILTEGEYFDIKHATTGGGIFDENHLGSYILQISKDNEVVSSLDLGNRNVGYKFEILFADFNEDGNIDFTIGDYLGSNYTSFNIYSILDNDTIQDSGSILTSEKKEENCYSMLFDYKDKTISTQFYDMEKGDILDVSYTWNYDDEKFILN